MSAHMIAIRRISADSTRMFMSLIVPERYVPRMRRHRRSKATAVYHDLGSKPASAVVGNLVAQPVHRESTARSARDDICGVDKHHLAVRGSSEVLDPGVDREIGSPPGPNVVGDLV